MITLGPKISFVSAIFRSRCVFVNEAWAIGGWLETGRAGSGTRSPWGRSGIPPNPDALSDKDGTALLAPGQEGITVLGQAYGQLRYRD